jgi:hypothetical protein
VACALVACSARPEQVVLERFFAASRLRDTTALAPIATTRFEPHIDGTVVTFEIVGVSEERPTPGPAGADAPSKAVTITAPVRLPDGATSQRTLVVTMQQVDRRWIVTGVRR